MDWQQRLPFPFIADVWGSTRVVIQLLLYTNSAPLCVKARLYVGAPFRGRLSASLLADKSRYGVNIDAVCCGKRENQNKSNHVV